MQKILILKMGTTFADSIARIGDFDKWILRSMPENAQEYTLVGSKDHPLPDPSTLSGLIITGSHSMITQTNTWERKAMHWVRWALDQGVPTLGLCYGHQMIAQVLGGTVGYLPDGPEIGYQRLNFFGEYEADPLFGLYPSHFETFTYHYQTIVKLPPGARAFARTGRERHHAVRYSEWVWGVQFHPEFTPAISVEYLNQDAQDIERAGYNVETLLNTTAQQRPSDPLIPRFVDLVLSRIEE